MNYKNLVASTNLALTEFSKKNIASIELAVYDSIIEQLKFILHEANLGNDPRDSLPKGQTFTYGVISSRNFTSPEELKLKLFLDDVSSHLYPEDFS